MKVTASEFKAKCLRLMSEVGTKHESILITKHGQPIAQLVPPPSGAKKPWLALKGAAKIKADIVRPALSDKQIAKWLKGEARHLHGAAH
jgi:prevent-host-death family protein